MLNRVSVNVILKSVIATLAAAVVVMLAMGAWSSWERLVAVKRIAAVAEASGHMFTALHNLRVDRSASFRDLMADKQFTGLAPVLRAAREGEMPALKAAVVALDAIDFPERQAVVSSLDQSIKKLAALHDESAAAILKPKAERRPALAQEVYNETNGLLETLDKLSSRLSRLVKLEDAFIDQLMELKQLAWLGRNAAGDASLLISNKLGGQGFPPDVMLKYTTAVSKLDTAWANLEDVAAGLPLPARFTDAVAKAKQGFLAPDYVDLRLKTLKALMAGEKVDIVVDDWSKMSVARLASLLGVAEAALDVAKEHAAAQRASATRMLVLQLVLLVLAVLFAGGMFLLVSRRVTGPLGQIQAAMMKLAGGDFGVAVPCLERKDEIGAMANAVERFKVVADEKARHEAAEATRRQQAEAALQAKAAEERAQLSEEQAEAFRALGVGLGKLASGDLTFRLTEGFSEAFHQIKDDFNTAMAQINETIGSIAASTREVANAAAEISTSTTDLSQRTEEQGASLAETTASMEHISVTVKKNAENAQQANQSASGTREVADRGGAVVAKAVSAMARIEESSRKISDIISVIDEIARQTNLLALNAAVEAARAGEAGRGFAVVASEVRSLAQRSSQAAKDIKDLITNSSGQVQEGVELVNQAGTALTEIVDSIKKVAGIVSEIAAASAEQATGLEQVNKALAQMDEVTQQNSALVEENAATAKTLEEQSQGMDERVSFFRLEAGAPSHAAAMPAHRPASKPAAAQVRSTAEEPSRSAASSASRPGKQPAAPMKRAAVGRTEGATALKDEADWKEF
jgi:methyl-accepting chemotaxis protein